MGYFGKEAFAYWDGKSKATKTAIKIVVGILLVSLIVYTHHQYKNGACIFEIICL